MRDVDIRRYVPPFLLGYAELRQVYEAENPEFRNLGIAGDKQLDSQFIYTADEDGIGRFEAMLGIDGREGDGLRERRLRAAVKWMDDIPYTFRVLKERLESLCGAGNYAIKLDSGRYALFITTHLEYQGQSAELEGMLDMFLPANIVSTVTNSIENVLEMAGAYAGGGIASMDCIELTD